MNRALKWLIGILGVVGLAFCGLVSVGIWQSRGDTTEPAAEISTVAEIVDTPETAATRVGAPTVADTVATAEPTRTVRPLTTPRPTATPRPSTTPTPRPTNTPRPTATAAPPTATALPPTATLEPTATLVPTPAVVGELATVTQVIDGDTIEVSMAGARYRVRYIGMDTPEIGSPCAAEATNANAALVAGQTVRMVRDVSETDRYDRLLRYVYVGETFVNGALVAGGWAIARDYPPDTAMSSILHSLEAQGAGRGCALVAAATAPADRAPAPVPVAPAPQPTATAAPVVGGGAVVIIAVDKRAEFVDIRNNGGDVNLAGWILRSEKGSQDCGLSGVLAAGQVLRIWAMAADAGQGGFNCGFGSNIWNNSEPDAALLIDPSGVVVFRW